MLRVSMCIASVTVWLYLISVPTWAFNPVEENSQWEVPRAGAPSQAVWETHHVEDVRAMAPVPVETFADRYGGDWYYQLNRSTETYHHVYGSGIDLGVTLSSQQAAETVAREFIRDNQSLFAIDEKDLDVMRNSEGLGKRSVIFQQMHRGIRVWGGRVHLVFTDSGRLFEMGSDAYTGIEISPVPALSESDALGIAKSDIGFQEGYDEVTHWELMVLPIEISEQDLDYRLAYRFDLKMDDPFGIWATWVDGNTGEILWRENHVRFIDFTGHSQGDVEWESYCDGYTTDYEMINMRIDISGVGTVYTDVNGDFTLSYGGSDSKSISAEFRGLWINVDRYTGTDASHSGTITPGVPYTIDWNSSNSIDAERDVFAYVNEEHARLKVIDPTFTDCDYEMTGWVERTDGYCPGNAWWDGVSINLCAQGSGYGNTGRMADVVYHEYGHAVTDFLYGLNDPPGDLHEGNSDIIANYLTRESIMGLGFYLDDCVSGIRNSDNAMQYPCSGSGHYCGQLIAGFHWDAWMELLAGYPQAYADSVASNTWHHGRALGLPQTQPDQVYWTFVADDNDGNLTNGTPHYDELCVGATNHGFECPVLVPGELFVTLEPVYPPGQDRYEPGDHPEFNMTVRDPQSGYAFVDVDRIRLWKSPPGEYLTPVEHILTGRYHFYHPGLYAMGQGWCTFSCLVEKTGYIDSGTSLRLCVGDCYCEPPSVSELVGMPSHFCPDTSSCPVRITSDLSSPCQVDAAVYRTATSELVRTLLADEGKPAGPDTLFWDLRDNGGSFAAPGDSYYVQVDIRRFVFNDLGDFGAELTNPCGIDIGDCGNGTLIYVADRDNHKVYVYNVDGTLRDYFGSQGNGAGEFWYPEDIAVCGAHIYVADLAFDGRIQKFDCDYSYVDSRTYTCAYPLCLACGPDGNLYFGSNFLRKLDSNLNVLEELYLNPHHISGICVTADGTIFAALSSEQYVNSYDSDLTLLCTYSSPYSGWYADIDCRETPYGTWLYYRHFSPNKGIKVYEVSGCSWSLINSYGADASTEMAIAVEDAYVVTSQYEAVRAKALCDASGRSSARVPLWSDGDCCAAGTSTGDRSDLGRFGLSGNWPNPFSAITMIEYQIHRYGPVSIRVYDSTGRLVQVLIDQPHPAGSYSVMWTGEDLDGTSVSPGIYFTRLQAGDQVTIRKVVLVR